MFRRALLVSVLIGLLTPAAASAGAKATVVGNFSDPTYITAPPGDTHRLFVVQQGGQIELIKDGGAPTTFLDISSEVEHPGGEQGLLSMAFAPDYATSRRFFVYYTSTGCPQTPGCDERVSEFTAESTGDSASASSEHVLITIPHPGQSNHNGGQLQFGPDGDLYISVGDGGGANDSGANAQLTDRLLGKILRILPGTSSYSIPLGNPFGGKPLCSGGSNGGSACPEVWAYGLRNPWRFSFDGATGDMVIADVGQDREEEIDYAHPGQNVGANYGWPCYEGVELTALRPSSECSPLPASAVAPVLTYPHPVNCAGAPFCGQGIIGGYVMHDPTLPSLNGCYVFGDLSTPGLRLVRLAQPSAFASVALGPQVASLSTFGEDASGHLYAADIGNGVVYRLESDGNAATNPRCQPAPGTPRGAQTTHLPVNHSAPLIHGSATPGATLSCAPGSWTGATSFAYQWLRDGVPRAAGATYKPRASDVGHGLSCRVIASNSAGNARANSATVRVKRGPPRVSALEISPSTFTAARSGFSVAPASAGAVVTFRLDERAILTIIVQRSEPGRKINGRCQRTRRSDRKARHCTRWGAVTGSFRITGRRGSNRFRFTGRIGGQTLSPGRYRLALRARDSGGDLATPVRARFSIRRRS